MLAASLTGLAGLASAQTAKDQAKVQVQWLGQAASKIISTLGKVIVIDPWLITNPKTPEALRKLEALAKLNNAPLWAPAGLAQSMQLLGILPVAQANRMNKSGTIRPIGLGIKITMTRAEHSSELVWRNPASDKDELHVGGEPAGFLIELENGFKIWHMGDTGVFGDMRLIGEMVKPDLVLMPIGGGQFVMNPADAAFAARDLIKAKAVIPMHYGTNPALPGIPEEFIKAPGSNSAVKVLVMQPGDVLEF